MIAGSTGLRQSGISWLELQNMLEGVFGCLCFDIDQLDL